MFEMLFLSIKTLKCTMKSQQKLEFKFKKSRDQSLLQKGQLSDWHEMIKTVIPTFAIISKCN